MNHRLLLWCAATDDTFELTEVAGRRALVGKCIHCGRKLAIDATGRPLSAASLEHIVPKTHGGTDELANLAIACARCNAQKGYRHDWKPRGDPKLGQLIETLQQRRLARLREPPESLTLPPLRPRSARAR